MITLHTRCGLYTRRDLHGLWCGDPDHMKGTSYLLRLLYSQLITGTVWCIAPIVPAVVDT